MSNTATTGWTKVPQVEGYYWMRLEHEKAAAEIVDVWRDGDWFVYCMGQDRDIPLKSLDRFEFNGPLTLADYEELARLRAQVKEHVRHLSTSEV
jgi:hypothetical protein